MKPAPGEWDDLRLLAKAADRGKAAEKLWPDFEKRLKELGYSGRAIAHAFAALAGPSTVTEALAKLEHYERLKRISPVRLAFEIVEEEPTLPLGHSLTITTVERDGEGIRIHYTIRPPLSPQAGPPRAEARDDREHEYTNGGGYTGTAPDRTTGGLTMPLPDQRASLLRVRMSWSKDTTSPWDRPAHELWITL